MRDTIKNIWLYGKARFMADYDPDAAAADEDLRPLYISVSQENYRHQSRVLGIPDQYCTYSAVPCEKSVREGIDSVSGTFLAWAGGSLLAFPITLLFLRDALLYLGQNPIVLDYLLTVPGILAMVHIPIMCLAYWDRQVMRPRAQKRVPEELDREGKTHRDKCRNILFAKQMHRFQSVFLRIPDRFCAFSPGPAEVSAQEGAQFDLDTKKSDRLGFSLVFLSIAVGIVLDRYLDADRWVLLPVSIGGAVLFFPPSMALYKAFIRRWRACPKED